MTNKTIGTLAALFLEIEKKAEVYEAAEAQKQMSVKQESEKPGMYPDEGKKKEASAEAGAETLKPIPPEKPATIPVVEEESGNKKVENTTPGDQKALDKKEEKKAESSDKPLKPLEATDKADMAVKLDEEGNKKLKSIPPGDSVKEAKVLSADDKPTNAAKEVTAEGAEAAKLDNLDPRKATEEASTAVGSAIKDHTMERSQEKGIDTSAVHTERGSQRAETVKKIASAIIKLAAVCPFEVARKAKEKKGKMTKKAFHEKWAKAVSKAQQKFMGMAHAVQKGKMKAPSAEVASVAKSMKPSDTTDFAETKRKGLPEHVKKEAMAKLAKYLQKRADADMVNPHVSEQYSFGQQMAARNAAKTNPAPVKVKAPVVSAKTNAVPTAPALKK